jgi:hypothetical protein
MVNKRAVSYGREQHQGRRSIVIDHVRINEQLCFPLLFSASPLLLSLSDFFVDETASSICSENASKSSRAV